MLLDFHSMSKITLLGIPQLYATKLEISPVLSFTEKPQRHSFLLFRDIQKCQNQTLDLYSLFTNIPVITRCSYATSSHIILQLDINGTYKQAGSKKEEPKRTRARVFGHNVETS